MGVGITALSRRTLLQAGAVLPLALWSRPVNAISYRQLRVTAPFDMPGIEVPDFSGSRQFPITDFGALPGDKAKTSAAIVRAIAAASASGLGTVVVPEGMWLTGQIHLRSNVNLHLANGATLLFSSDPADYLPPVPTSWEGIECYNYSPLIYAYECENVGISGEGTLKADLGTWRIWFERPTAHMDALIALYNKAVKGVPVAERQMVYGEAHLRPHFIQFNRCRHVLVEDISIQDSPFWVLHPFLCRDVVVRRVKIRAHGHNNDGIDPEMTQNMLIEDCVFDQGDDAVSVKSGREFDGWRLDTPARNIVMRNCQIKNGHQLMAIGSELSGGVENVFVDNCHFIGDGKGADGTAVPINNLLYVKTNERRGGFVRNIFMSNVTATKIAGGILGVETDVLYQWRDLVPTYERRLTPIENLQVKNVTVGEAQFVCSIKADPAMPVKNVLLDNVRVAQVLGTPITTENVRGFVDKKADL